MATAVFSTLFREEMAHSLVCSLFTSLVQTAFSQRPTLGLKAMSFRIISTVKRPVKSMLSMFMAILKRQLWP